MRPMFVFLSAGLCGKINESTFRGASLIELLHTATLVHDDVVDEANYPEVFYTKGFRLVIIAKRLGFLSPQVAEIKG